MLAFSLNLFSETEVLTDEQNRWVQKATTRVYDLMEETPPEGKKFVESVKLILKKEQHWIHWKNEGCPPFTEPKEKKDQEESKAGGSLGN